MKWQDAVISVVSILFAVALVPTLKAKTKPAFLTSTLTAAGLSSLVAVYLSLGLWFSAATTAVSTVMWAAIACQSI